MDELTERQAQILAFVREYHGEHGYPPTRREIAAAVGLATPSAVQYHITRLAALGHLRRDFGVSRGLVLTEVA